MSAASKTSVMAGLQPHLADFYKIVSSAWDDYQSLPAEALVRFTPRSQASIVHDFIVARAAKYCEQHDDVVQFEVGGMKGILVSDKYAIRFKKLDNLGLPRNQPTFQVTQFRSQENLDGLPDVIHLELGYITDQFDIEVKEIRLVCPSGKDANLWEVAISETSIQSVVEDLFANVESGDAGETKFTPKTEKKQGGKVVNIRNTRDVD
jgi:hypothetical protein